MGLIDYIRLIKFRYHLTFLITIIAALSFADSISFSLFKSLLVLYLSFNVLLYGGIYAMNDIADVKADKKHPLKRRRPIPCGKININNAKFFSVSFIVFGLLIGFLFFGAAILYLHLIFLFINLFYTFIAKKIAYLELIINGSTHTLRFLMGVLLVKGSVSYLFLLAFWLLAFGIACVRRSVEKDVKGWEARPTLKFYSKKKMIFLICLAFSFILFLALADIYTLKILYAIVIFFYIISVFGIFFSKNIRSFYRLCWTQ